MPTFSDIPFMRVSGIRVAVDWTLVVVFLLLVLSLGAGVFPIWHPDWSSGLSFTMAVLGALLFVASVLAHEMAHALVGRARGVPVEHVTLHVFGGIAHLEREPSSWRTELLTAVVGPITSFLLAGIGIGFVSLATRDIPVDPDFPLAAMMALSPATTLFLWVGQVNLMLALFNLIPGFPLDGGRLLRALIWGASGNLRLATRVASQAGRFFGWVFIFAGLAMALGFRMPWLGVGVVSGFWVALLGAFLHRAATRGDRPLRLGASLSGVKVAQLMESDFASVGAETPVDELVQRYLLPTGQRAFPVLDGGRFAGLVSLPDVRKVPRDLWATTPVRAVMTPADGVSGVTPEASAVDAMVTLGRRGVNQLPVLKDGQVRGLVSRESILRVLSLYGDPCLAQ